MNASITKVRLRNTFLLPTADTPDRGVAHHSTLDVVKPENRLVEIREDPGEFATVLALYPSLWCPRLGGEMNGLVNGKSWKVNVILRAILNVSAKMFRELSGRDGIVEYVPLNRVKRRPMVCQDLQEGAATRPWATQYH